MPSTPKYFFAGHRLSIWALPLILLLTLGGTFVWFGYDDYEHTIEREFRALESNGRIAEAQISSLLRNIEQLLDAVAAEQATLTPAQRANYDAVLAEKKSKFPEIRSLVLISANGRVEFSATPKLKGFDASQRDYFVAHRGAPLPHNFHISRPFKTATGNDISIAFSVALYDARKTFLGIVAAGVDPKYFDGVLSQIKPAETGAVAALINDHGELIYRVPDPDRYKEARINSPKVLSEQLRANRPVTRRIGASATDGKQRLFSFRRIGETNLRISIGAPLDAVLADWYRNVILRALIFVLTAAITLGLAWLAQRREKDRRRAAIALENERDKAQGYLDLVEVTLVALDHQGQVTMLNRKGHQVLGYADGEVVGRNWFELCLPADEVEAVRMVYRRIMDGDITPVASYENRILRKDGNQRLIAWHNSVQRDATGRIIGTLSSGEDITERRQAERQLAEQFESSARMNAELVATNRLLGQAQAQLLQSEKLASIGLLAAGVAHEINNPIGYVNSNLESLRQYLADIFAMLDKYEDAQRQIAAPSPVTDAIRDFRTQIDLDFVRADIQTLLAESREGLKRVKKIVLDLKNFSRAGSEEEWQRVDLLQGLDSTLNVVWNELKYKCEVHRECQPLPLVECLPSQLNQVFMNLLVNASQAIESTGVITIRSGHEGDFVWLEFSDTGHGIAPENLSRLFDPFFTTKPVGVGTGLGLSVSHGIVGKHHGRIDVRSELGTGTTFRVWLPVNQPAAATPEATPVDATSPATTD